MPLKPFSGKTYSLVIAALVFSMMHFGPAALASGCGSSQSSSSGLEHGSGINDDSVTICVGTNSYSEGSSETSSSSSGSQKTEITTNKKKPKTKAPVVVAIPAPKPAAKPKQPRTTVAPTCPTVKQLLSMPTSADAIERWVDSVCRGIPKPDQGSKQKQNTSRAPEAKPKPTPKTVVTNKVRMETKTQPGTRQSASGQAQFTSNKLTATNYPSGPLGVFQETRFSANALLHFRSGSIIGKQAEVKFTPAGIQWNFGDGSQATGNDLRKSYSEPGLYLVTARVSYSVSYRLVGETSWQEVSGGISTLSNQLWVSVDTDSSSGGSISQDIPLLVGAPCSRTSGKYGCTA